MKDLEQISREAGFEPAEIISISPLASAEEIERVLDRLSKEREKIQERVCSLFIDGKTHLDYENHSKEKAYLTETEFGDPQWTPLQEDEIIPSSLLIFPKGDLHFYDADGTRHLTTADLNNEMYGMRSTGEKSWKYVKGRFPSKIQASKDNDGIKIKFKIKSPRKHTPSTNLLCDENSDFYVIHSFAYPENRIMIDRQFWRDLGKSLHLKDLREVPSERKEIHSPNICFPKYKAIHPKSGTELILGRDDVFRSPDHYLITATFADTLPFKAFDRLRKIRNSYKSNDTLAALLYPKSSGCTRVFPYDSITEDFPVYGLQMHLPDNSKNLCLHGIRQEDNNGDRYKKYLRNIFRVVEKRDKLS